MSYVHFVDVFDMEGAPAALSDRDAAEQAKGRRLAVPSPRLLALLTHIRQRTSGITVNVLGGAKEEEVRWVAGEPPRVEGEGATCALWTLILPVGEDIEELEEAMPQIEEWVETLGLCLYDALR
ncbi:MAG: hypothetical protein KBF33_04380 [Comamonas sp.]|nr:hypothetical protein [Comamonas sp.]